MSDFRRSSGEDDRALFEQAMREVDRLPEGKERVRGRRRSEGSRQPPPTTKQVRFAVERRGEHHEGLAPGIDRRQLHRLRDGEWPVDQRVNVRRLRAAVARDAVLDALARASRDRQRCLLVVHGRGRRSTDGPVLKAALPEWLSEPPHGRRVMAFVSAPPELGGTGATLVLLRRPRRA